MRGAPLLALLVVAGCATGAPPAPPKLEASPPPSVDVGPSAGPWTADPRWKSRVSEIDAAARAALQRIAAQTALAPQGARRPVVVFDAAAPREGDAAVRFVEGVRRPVVRLRPAALLAGTFRTDAHLGALLARGAILAAAGERAPPDWVAEGVPVVVAGAFERLLHERALGGAQPVSAESALFGDPPAGALASAARAKALARIARTERPFVRFLDAVARGASEEAALAEVGVAGAEFLDAAAATERARAARALAGDPLFAALVEARAAMARADAATADAALARAGTLLAAPDANPWVAADARLVLAEIARSRSEPAAVRAALDAARAGGRVVRVRAARSLEAFAADGSRRAEAERDLRADEAELAGER